MKTFISTKRLITLSFLLIMIVAMVGAISLREPAASSAAPVYELRSYHIQPDQLENYKTWIGTHGLPHIRKHMEVVGFWVQGDIEAQISGAEMDEMGPANVSWTIKWESMEAREAGMAETFTTDEWKEIFSKFPGGREAYLRTEVRFFEAL